MNTSREYAKYTSLNVLGMIGLSCYILADTFFVGRINTQSTAAVGVVFSVMAVIQALGFFFGHGSGNYISRKLGAKDFEEAAMMASNGFFLAFLCGLAVTAGGILFLEPLALALGSTPTILPYTEAYLRVILLGAPFMTSSLVLNNQLRFQGSAAYAMVGIVTGAVINIILDPILIFGFGMGVAGGERQRQRYSVSSAAFCCCCSRAGKAAMYRFASVISGLIFII